MSSNIFDTGSTCGAFRVLAFHSRSPVTESYIARHVETSLHVLLTCSRFDQPGAEPPAESQFVGMVAKLTGIVDAEIKSPRVLDGGVNDGVFWVVREHFRDAITVLDLIQGERGSTRALQSLSDELNENLGRTMAALAIVIGLAISYTLDVFAERGIIHGALDITRTIAIRGDGKPIVLDVGYRDLFGPRFFEHDPSHDYRAPEVRRGEAPNIQSDIWSLGTIVHGFFFAALTEMQEGEALTMPDSVVKGATQRERGERFSSWAPFHDALQVFGGKAIDRGREVDAARPAPSSVKDEVTDIVASGERTAKHRNGEDADATARAARPVLPDAPGSRTRTADESESVETNPCPSPVSNQEVPPVEEFPTYSQGMACIASESLDPSAPSVALSYTRERETFTPHTSAFAALEPVAASAPVVVEATPTAADDGVSIAASEPTALDAAAARDSEPIVVDFEPAEPSAPVVVADAPVTVRVVAPLTAPVDKIENPAANVAFIPPKIDTARAGFGPRVLSAPSTKSLISPGGAQSASVLSMRPWLVWAAAPAVAVLIGMLGLRAVLSVVDRNHAALEQAGQPRSADYARSSYSDAHNCETRPLIDWSAVLRFQQPARKSEVK